VHGPWVRRQPAERVHGGDLRAAAMLLLAALAVPGTTVISGSEHLVRGYADLTGALRALGADITTGELR
jgi:UDP-N-acetylglucosamine enolpyruvyl transferase